MCKKVQKEPNIRNHKIFKVVEYAFNNPYFTETDVKEACGLTEQEFRIIVNKTMVCDTRILKRNKDGNIPKWYMGSDSFFNYLEYLELKEARESAKTARNVALWAIGISAFLAFGSIITQVIGLVECN
ncbi:MAG: hypothetical protein HQ553_00840 [Chloroflexi bacterium]|nr:hypothetical protein [Chloroflexota bacterium]